MTREEKQTAINGLKEMFSKYNTFYLADDSSLTAIQMTKLRKICFQQGVEYKVCKNTLVQKALEAIDKEKYQGLFDSLKGSTSLLFTEASNTPAKIIKNFRKNAAKPLLKAAFIESAIFVGDQHLETLSQLKSKKELIGDVIALLQSPAKNVIAALQSGGQKISGVLKTLSEKKS